MYLAFRDKLSSILSIVNKFLDSDIISYSSYKSEYKIPKPQNMFIILKYFEARLNCTHIRTDMLQAFRCATEFTIIVEILFVPLMTNTLIKHIKFLSCSIFHSCKSYFQTFLLILLILLINFKDFTPLPVIHLTVVFFKYNISIIPFRQELIVFLKQSCFFLSEFLFKFV